MRASIFTTLLFLTFPAASYAADIRYVTADKLNVRLCPAVTCPATASIYRGNKVEVFEMKNGWARISHPYDGIDEDMPGEIVARWVSAAYLSTRRSP